MEGLAPFVLFRWLDKRTLLACRATCRRWRDKLASSELWAPFTADMGLSWDAMQLPGLTGALQTFERVQEIRRNIAASRFTAQELEFRHEIKEAVGECCGLLMWGSDGPFEVFRGTVNEIGTGTHRGEWTVYHDRFILVESGDAVTLFDMAAPPGEQIILDVDDIYGGKCRVCCFFAHDLCRAEHINDISGTTVAIVHRSEDDDCFAVDIQCLSGSSTLFLWKLEVNGSKTTARFVRHKVLSLKHNEEEEDEEGEDIDGEEARRKVEKPVNGNEGFACVCLQGTCYATLSKVEGPRVLRVYNVESGEMVSSFTHPSWAENAGAVKQSDSSIGIVLQDTISVVNLRSGEIKSVPHGDHVWWFDRCCKDEFSGVTAVVKERSVPVESSLSFRIGDKTFVVPADCAGWHFRSFAKGVVFLTKEKKLRMVRFDGQGGDAAEEPALKSRKV